MKHQTIYNEVSKGVNDWAKSELSNLGAKFEPGIPYFIQLQNFLSKNIRPLPRKVSISQTFNIPDKHKVDFDLLISKISEGKSLKKHLSRLTRVAYFSDEFLDLYGLHHFHFKKGGSGYLALALVNDTEIFFVEVKQHIDKDEYVWTNKSVLETIHKERPDLIHQFKAPDYLKLNGSDDVSNQEVIKNLQNNGYTFFITLDDGTTYMPSKLGRVTFFRKYKLIKKTRNFIKMNQNCKKCGSDNFTQIASLHYSNLIYCCMEIQKNIDHYIKNFTVKYDCKVISIELLELKSINFKTFNSYKVKFKYETNKNFGEIDVTFNTQKES